MDVLPDDLLIEIGLRLNLRDLFSLGGVSRRFSSLFYWSRSPFWKKRYLRDFGSVDTTLESWKEEYKVETCRDIFVSGSNFNGELGIGTTRVNNLPTLTKLYGKKADMAIAGRRHSAIIDSDRNVYVFGNSNYDSNYLETPTHLPELKAKTVSFGTHFTLIIDTEGNVWFFGEVSLRSGYFYESYQIPGIKAVQIAAGSYHALILDTEGSVWGFGENSNGQLGVRIDYYETVPVEDPVRIPGLRADFIAAGGFHSLVIDRETAYLFGSNQFGELGLGQLDDAIVDAPIPLEGIKVKSASLGYVHTIIIDQDDSIWVFGDNMSGQIGIAEKYTTKPVRLEGLKARQVSTNSMHTLIIALDRTVWALGRNDSGQLGLITVDEIIPRPVQIPEFRAKSVSAGAYHSLIIGKRMN